MTKPKNNKTKGRVVDITPVPFAPLVQNDGKTHYDLVIVSLEQLIEVQGEINELKSEIVNLKLNGS